MAAGPSGALIFPYDEADLDSRNDGSDGRPYGVHIGRKGYPVPGERGGRGRCGHAFDAHFQRGADGGRERMDPDLGRGERRMRGQSRPVRAGGADGEPDVCAGHRLYQGPVRLVPYDYSRSFVPTNRNTVPGTPSGTAEPTPPEYQLTIIGGFTDAFHFHPVLVRGTSAVIYPHNNVLEYGHKYRVTVDESVFPAPEGSRKGHALPRRWTFTTAAEAPSLADTLVVDASGAGDFCTLQGALDLIPDFSAEPVVIKVMPGDYEEIVYVRNKTHVTIIGSGADVTRVHYANNEVFNPHPLTVKTNERAGTFPQRRAAVAFDHCNDLILKDITFATDLMGQAEGLFLCGDRIALYGVHSIGDRRRRRHHPRPRQPLRLPLRLPQPRRPLHLGPQLQARPRRHLRRMHLRKHHRHPRRLRPLPLQPRLHLPRRRNGPPRLPRPQPPPPRLERIG